MAGKDEFGNWLKRRRRVLGLTQKELAQQAGCAEVTVRKVEAGDHRPTAQLAESLAKAVGATGTDLPGLVALARGLDSDLPAAARRSLPRRANNLPAQLTPLFGREHDIAAVRKRLLADGARLVTLLGPPGVGKTRLAQAAAEDVLEHFEHGAFFVRLAPIGDPAQVASAIAQALGLQMSGPNPPELQLRAYLEEKHLLLVLDNFEHLVAAAPQVDDLLRRCPWLFILATSRQPLRVRGERQITVRSLALPVSTPDASRLTAADALRYAAVALFAERAEAVQHDFAVDDANATAVAALCRRLDGLPLAIELVAARVKLLPPAELLQRLHGPWLLSADGLRDVSARQKTLRGAIGWSYDLLSPAEQILFTRLAVFVGGWTLEAAEMMCEDILSPAQVLDGIASLLDKNLLHREAGLYGELRYAMLETVREYGLQQLADSGEEFTVRARHADCFLVLLEKAARVDLSPRRIQQCRLIDGDLPNILAGLAWETTHNLRAALLLAAPLLFWYTLRGRFAEGLHLNETVLARPGASAHPAAHATALFEMGILMMIWGDLDKAQAYEEQSLLLSQELGDAKREADALLGLGRIANIAYLTMGGLDKPYELFERALACYKIVRDPGGIAYATALLSMIHIDRAELTRARALCEESLAVAQEAGFLFPWPTICLGQILYLSGDLDRARSTIEHTLELVRQQESKIMLRDMLNMLGMVATRQGEFVAAHALLDEALTLHMELGLTKPPTVCYLNSARLLQMQDDYLQALKWYRLSLEGLENRLQEGDYSACACFLPLAALAQVLNQHELSARLLGASEAVADTIQPLFPIDRDDYGRLAETACSRLGVERFDAARMQGRKERFAQIAEEAVSILEAALAIETNQYRFLYR